MHTNLFKILCFSCQGKSRDVVYQCTCLFLWLIFAQHGLFEIQLTVYSALSRLTDLGIYDITRCGIWLLKIFHIQYIHFQRELRKVTSPKWHLSFFVQYSYMYTFAYFTFIHWDHKSVTIMCFMNTWTRVSPLLVNIKLKRLDNDHTTKTVYGSELASLTDTVASLYTKQKVKHSVRKSIPNEGMLLWHWIILKYVWFGLSKEMFGDQYLINT